MQNVWRSIEKGITGGPYVLWVMFIAVCGLVLGAWFFAEDYQSSRQGIQLLETIFALSTVNYQWTYSLMSIAPQIGQVLFIALFSVNIKKNWWAAVVAAAWFLLDFISDVQDRSGGHFIELTPAGIQHVNWDARTIVASVETFFFFTIGSELFLTASVALIITLFSSAVSEYVKLRGEVKRELRKAREILNEDSRERPTRPRNDDNVRYGPTAVNSEGFPMGQPVRMPRQQTNARQRVQR